MNVSVIW